VAISVDPPDVTRNLCQKSGYSFTFLSDPRAEVIRRYDLLDKGAGEGGADVARPAEFLLDRNGVVRWRSLTDDYRVRARPEELIAAVRSNL
jgi:peroxiredoxin